MKNLTFFALLLIFSTNVIMAQKSSKSESSDKEFKIEYEKFVLDNGLEVVLHKDNSDPIVAVATMMHAGSNREKPGKTGFAHFFEHMSFNDSENVPVGASRKLVPEWGGSRNGGTSNDRTVYYEVVPTDAFEKILWMDSDRLGYMINTVTKSALEREKQVVKNEKRERVDNSPYGYTEEIIRKNLYPEGHPYNWTVIGSLPDLQAATLEDVTEFYNQFYGPGNATLAIVGDIDIEKTKELVKKWFGEIKKGPPVPDLKPQPVTIAKTKSLSFEDNFAKLPELTLIFPSVEEYNKDDYALQVLGQLLSGSKKSPLYKIIVEEKKLAPEVNTYQYSSEIAGEFRISVRANEGISLDEVKTAIDEGLKNFETNGFTDEQLQRIKAELETQLYFGVSTVLNKAFRLAQDNEFAGDPSYITKTAKYFQAVTKDDVMRVFNKYVNGQNYIMTSVVPKGSLNLAVQNSEKATVWEEEVTAMDASEEVGQGEAAEYEKTKTIVDRSEPSFGKAPLLKIPEIWTGELKNGVKLFGIYNNELPVVNFRITIDGGHSLDNFKTAGLASFTADLMNEGTAIKTPAQLEEAIGLLGSSIRIYGTNEEIVISASSLSRNFEKTLALVEEMLLQPRWDKTEFDRLKQELITNLKDDEANPSAIARNNFNKLVYGENNIYSVSASGNLESSKNVTLDEVKSFYKNLTPNLASFQVAGDVNEKSVKEALKSLSSKWKSTKIHNKVADVVTKTNNAGNLYFIDVPDSKQSVIIIGQLALSEYNKDASKLSFANEILGGGSSGKLFQTLRIEKGYTYGAYSRISGSKEMAPFAISTSVRANATLPSLEIITDMVKNYGSNFTAEDVALTQNKIIKQNTRSYESLGAKLGMLQNISKYNKPLNYIEEEQDVLMAMQLEDFKTIISKYIVEDDMIYLVVGDKKTQLEEVKKLGKNVIELDINGNVVQ